MAIAHTKNSLGVQQDLVEHLGHVALRTREFASHFHSGDVGYLVGLLHDIGKFDPDFQRYLLDAEQGKRRSRSPDHKGAGSVFALKLRLEFLSFLVQGHHGGLCAKKDVGAWLKERGKDAAVQQAIQKAQEVMQELKHTQEDIVPPFLKTKDSDTTEFFNRMLFSALVDADFLDTEAHFNPQQSLVRGHTVSIDMLCSILERDQEKLSGHRGDILDEIRHKVYLACLKKAVDLPGFYRLEVPTGGGKTRSSLVFALKHARHHGKRRIIYAIPFISITEQIASEFQSIFDEYPDAVLEHHSNALAMERGADAPPSFSLERLAAENWDAPIIVTTTVQFFESLFANQTSRCRKLHNIANSVVVLDEIQLLPPQLLRPIISVLQELVTNYGVTVVLSSATQPALQSRECFDGLHPMFAIIDDPAPFFVQLKRVTYHWPDSGQKQTWNDIAAMIEMHNRILTIVNTRKDAVHLIETILAHDAEDLFHLSTRMCGAHRRRTLVEIRQRLKEQKRCRLVATQVVEAGVDLDFDVGIRVRGPLSSIVQAAGRVNREGRRATGDVYIVDIQDSQLPPGVYRIGTQITQAMGDELDMHDPSVYERYFSDLYRSVDLDERKVQAARSEFDYPEVSKRFQMIEDYTDPMVIVDEHAGDLLVVQNLLDELASSPEKARRILRQLQPYIVTISQSERERAEKKGVALEIMPGLWRWQGYYHPVYGIDLEAFPDPMDHIL